MNREEKEKNINIPERIIEQDLDVTDIEILNEIADPEFLKEFEKEIARKVAEKQGMDENDVYERIQKLKEKKIIYGIAALVDPLKIWNHVIFTFVKMSLSPPILEEEIVKKYPSGWKGIGKFLEEFSKENEIAKKILRGAWTLIGTEWDLLVMSTTNDLTEHRKMFEEFVRRGVIGMARSFFPIEGAPYVFRPYLVPPAEEIKEEINKLKEKIKNE